MSEMLLLFCILILSIVFFIVLDSGNKKNNRLTAILEKNEFAIYSDLKKEMIRFFFGRSVSASVYATFFLILATFVLMIVLFILIKDRETNVHTYSLDDITNNVENKYLSRYLSNNKIDLSRLEPIEQLSMRDTVRKLYLAQMVNEIDSVATKTSRLDSLREKEYQRSHLPKTLEFFHGLLVKFTTAFLGFFLIQVFLKLYRYNQRIGDFYRTMFEALISTQELPGNLKEALEMYKHDIEFGNSPKVPAEALLEIMKSMNSNR